MLIAQATATERGLFLVHAFLWLLTGCAIVVALYVLAYLVIAPVLAAAGTPGLQRLRRILTGYLIVAPLVLYNLVAVFVLFTLQFVAVQWLYGTVANPHRIFGSAFEVVGGGAPHGVQAEIVDRLKRSAGFRSSAYYGPTAGLSRFMWTATGAFNWVILFALLLAMLRDLAVTSWAFLAAPIQREVQGRPWGELVRRALARFLHVLLYTIVACGFFAFCALGLFVLGWATLRMIAGLLVTYLAAIESASGGFLPFLLLGSFYACMLEVLGAFILVTTLLSFIASRSISLQLEDGLAQVMRLPRSTALEPKLWQPLRASGLLLGKVFVATVPIWMIMAFVAGPLLPLAVSAPVGALLHLVAFNVLLALLRAHRNLKPLVVEAWTGRPWSGMGAAGVPSGDSRPATG